MGVRVGVVRGAGAGAGQWLGARGAGQDPWHHSLLDPAAANCAPPPAPIQELASAFPSSETVVQMAAVAHYNLQVWRRWGRRCGAWAGVWAGERLGRC